MKYLSLLFCCLLLVASVPQCYADAGTVNGVLAQERVINLPQDQEKWYVSVVGNQSSGRYQQVLGWFAENKNLRNLKDDVHFCQVSTDSAIYKERYASTLNELPAVRMQKANGTIVYEATGADIPMSADGLYGALANSVQSAQGIRILPWRMQGQGNCCPRPQPQPPEVVPVPVDPEPQPIDDGGKPDVDGEGAPNGAVVWIAITCLLSCGIIGTAIGAVFEWKKSAEK